MPAMTAVPAPEDTVGRQGNYAGGVSRLVAFLIDLGVIWGLYVLGTGAVSLASQLITGHSLSVSNHQILAVVVLVIWGFLYFSYQWALSGRTVGMAILGIQVVSADGSPIAGRQAAVRALTLPLSFIVFFLGLLGILTNRERRAWHDRFAGTCVVYSWDARAARLRWLAHKDPNAPALPVQPKGPPPVTAAPGTVAPREGSPG
jgi:uncharacterized RDD family membrane protein YckC